MKFLINRDELDLLRIKELDEKRCQELKGLIEKEISVMDDYIRILKKDASKLDFKEKQAKMNLFPFYTQELKKLEEQSFQLHEAQKQLNMPKAKAPVKPPVAAKLPAPVPAPVKVMAPVPPPAKLPAPVAPRVVAPVPPPAKLPAPVAPRIVAPVPPPAKLPLPAKKVINDRDAILKERQAEYKNMTDMVAKMAGDKKIDADTQRNILDVIQLIREFDLNGKLHAERINKYYDDNKNAMRYGIYCPTHPKPETNKIGRWVDFQYTAFHAEYYNPYFERDADISVEKAMREIVDLFHKYYNKAKEKNATEEFLSHDAWVGGCIEGRLKAIYKDFIKELDGPSLDNFIKADLERYNAKYGIDGNNPEHLKRFELLQSVENYRDYIATHGNKRLLDGSRVKEHMAEITEFLSALGYDKNDDIVFKEVQDYCRLHFKVDLKTIEELKIQKDILKELDRDTIQNHIYRKITGLANEWIYAFHKTNLKKSLDNLGFKVLAKAPPPPAKRRPPTPRLHYQYQVNPVLDVWDLDFQRLFDEPMRLLNQPKWIYYPMPKIAPHRPKRR